MKIKELKKGNKIFALLNKNEKILKGQVMKNDIKEYRGFKYTSEYAEDLKNTLDIDIINLIDGYINNNVSSLIVNVGHRTYNIDIKDNNINVMLKLIRP